MAKRKDLLLTESTTMRMMGLAGIGSLANPFLREGANVDTAEDPNSVASADGMGPDGDKYAVDDEGDVDMVAEGDYMDEDLYEGEELEEMDDLMDEDLYLEEDEDLEEAKEKGKEKCPHCHKIHEGDCGAMKESIRRSMSKLKRLLEQAEADAPPPPAAEPPPVMEGGDEMEAKIKEFVKKLGELVQETLGVEVKVEEEGEEGMKPAEGGEGETGEPPAPPAGGAGAPPPPPAALQEAIDRLVNKVVARVKARLMEAKKDPKVAAAKAKKLKMMKEKQMAAKKKEKEEAAKKKEMEMKKKKAAMMKKK